MDGKRHSLSIFESATLRLTAWYMLLMMLLSLVFSGVLYGVATSEVNRALGPMRPGEMHLFINDDNAADVRQQRIQDSTGRLVVSLVIFNISVLVGGSVLSYLLARRTLQPIQAAHDAQARFASDAAHELRTPLAVMQTEIEVGLRNKKATAGEYKETLSSTLEELSRLRTLTDRLLLLASQQELPCGATDVEAATVEAVTHVVPLAQQKHINIDNRVGAATVNAYYESVVDILGILLDNAIKYSPEKTTITITGTLKNNMVEIAVADEGPGIPAEEQEKIFERFYRSDASRSKENVDGYGLGLSLALRLATDMRGGLAVHDGVEKGAVFVLSLPLYTVQ